MLGDPKKKGYVDDEKMAQKVISAGDEKKVARICERCERTHAHAFCDVILLWSTE